MRKMLILSLAMAALLATTAASSAQSHALGRSGVHQPDISTCSSNRLSCLRATNYRGQSNVGCHKAYRACMSTGTWDTYGYYGRRVTGVARQ
jgi:hypothetical protein